MAKTASAADVADTILKPGLLSPQVSGPRYFFLNLGSGGRRAGVRAGLALGGREHCNPDYRIERSGFAYDVLEYVAEGAGWVKLGSGQKHALAPGSVFVSAAAEPCAMGTEAERPMVKYFLCLAGDESRRRLVKMGLAAGRVRTVSAHGEIRSVMEDLVREGQRPGPRAGEICGVLFELLALKLADALPRGGRGGAVVDGESARENFLRAKAIMDARADRLATLEDVAAAARLDVSTVCRLFKRFQGISPYQYLLRRKMNLAAEFLVDGRGLVKHAAQKVGFADPYHFSRCFKAVHGVPPSQLQRRG